MTVPRRARRLVRAGRLLGPSRHAVRALTVIGLVVDAVIHLQLAPSYQLAAPGGVGEGTLFRVESVVALLAAAYVLIRGSRFAYVVAALVASSALVAVMLSRYVDIPAFGPIPSMYEPIWFGKKVATAVAEALALGTALIGLFVGIQSKSDVDPNHP